MKTVRWLRSPRDKKEVEMIKTGLRGISKYKDRDGTLRKTEKRLLGVQKRKQKADFGQGKKAF